MALLLIPLRDDGPPGPRTIATPALMAVCLGVFLWLQLLTPERARAVVERAGLVPAELLGTWLPPSALAEPLPWLAPVTSLFLHAGWLHLLANLAYLWLFGRGLEAVLGAPRFILLFLASGTAAALAQTLGAPSSHLPLIGASGGVAGLLGAYLMLFPRANLRILTVFWNWGAVVHVPALLGLAVWLLIELPGLGRSDTTAGGSASFAHLGGFAAGALLVPLLRRPGTTLFQAARTRAFSVLPLTGR
jgi:membrane associated rhomboid family serine protease